MSDGSARRLESARTSVRRHLSDHLYRTGYYLIIGTGVTSVLGVVFWAVAARSYSPSNVGANAASISACTFVSGVCSLGLGAVLVRYLPISGQAAGALVVRIYALTAGLSLVIGAAVAATSNRWSSSLSFLASPGWIVGFAIAASATTIFNLEDGVLTGLRSAQWVPIENSAYSVAKLGLLAALAGLLPKSGPFIAWNAPLLPVILFVNALIFFRLIRNAKSPSSLERRVMVRMAAGNYAGNLFFLTATMYMPVLVANRTSTTDAAYFYVPWLFALSLQLIAINLSSSLTVEAARDMSAYRRLTRQALTHSLRVVVPFAAVTFAAAPWILSIFGSHYASAGTALLRWLAMGAVPNVIVSIALAMSRVEHRGREVLLIQGAGAIVVVGLSAALLPSFGIVSVGICWFVAQTVLAIIMLATKLRPLMSGWTDPALYARRATSGKPQR
jgi:O-antigen/teichoic acid export membrane protein